MPDDLETNNAIALVENTPGDLLHAIISMAKDPTLDVDKFKTLLELQHNLEVRQAEIEFARALARLSSKLPQIPKNGRVSLGEGKGSYPFAKWEDMDRILRPLLAEEGFALSFTSQTLSGGLYEITGTLLHRDGHFIKSSVALPPNTGPGRNELQAMGGALAYGKRYCAEMLCNIVREGQDTDANANKPFGGFAGARNAPKPGASPSNSNSST